MGYDLLGLMALGYLSLFLGAAIITTINIVVLIATYLLTGISLYKLAMNNGHQDKAILAWIPVVNLYLVGLLAGDTKLLSIDLPAQWLGIILVILRIMGGFGDKSPFILWLISTILIIFAFYNLYKRAESPLTVIMAILSLIPFLKAIFLYTIKDRNLLYFYE